jgi:hypothetical protein
LNQFKPFDEDVEKMMASSPDKGTYEGDINFGLEWEGQSLNKTYQGRSDATVAQR